MCVTAAGTAAEAAHAAASAQTRSARTVKLQAGFSPERLGGATTLTITFQIAAHGQLPPPLTAVELFYPNELGIGTSSLGLENCSIERLQAGGPEGCGPNSHMGSGSALVQVPIGPKVLHEKAKVTLFAGPVQDGHLGLLFFASGLSPVIAELVFPGDVLPATHPYGGVLSANLPLVPTVPEGPDVILTELQTSLGAAGLTYYEQVKGKTVSYHPQGILLPATCPSGGFPFSIRVGFLDDTQATGRTTVPCPGDPKRHRAKARRRRRR